MAGHTSERSLADYEEGDEAEQRQISSIISSPVGRKVHNSRPVLSSLPIQHSYTATPACQIVVNHFYGCQVTINYGAGVGVFQERLQLNAGIKLPIPCLNLRFRFAAAVTAKTVIENYFH